MQCTLTTLHIFLASVQKRRTNSFVGIFGSKSCVASRKLLELIEESEQGLRFVHASALPSDSSTYLVPSQQRLRSCPQRSAHTHEEVLHTYDTLHLMRSSNNLILAVCGHNYVTNSMIPAPCSSELRSLDGLRWMLALLTR